MTPRTGTVAATAPRAAMTTAQRSAARSHPSAVETGLTLLETLIVLAVIAIAAGATTLSLAPRRGNATEVEARLLAGSIQAAADRGLATGAHAVLVVDDRGYAVDGAARHLLPSGIAIDGAPAAALPLDLESARPFVLVVAAGSDRWTVAFDGVRAAVTPATDAA